MLSSLRCQMASDLGKAIAHNCQKANKKKSREISLEKKGIRNCVTATSFFQQQQQHDNTI
jgi:hypothetical protein